MGTGDLTRASGGPVPSTPIVAATCCRHPIARRAGALLLATSVLVACSSGGERVERTTTTTSTAAEDRCPDGSTVPDAPPAPEPTSPAPEPSGPDGRDGALDIAALLPRTGDLSFLGAASIAGVQLAVEDLDSAGGVLGAAVGLRHADSAEGTPGTAEAELGALLAGGADVVIGPLSSGTASRVLPQVVGAAALLVSPAATSSGLDALDRTGRLFRTGAPEALQGRALADLITADGHRSASLAVRADDHGRALADALTARLAGSGTTVTARVDYDPSDPKLGAGVVDGLDLSADAVVVIGLADSALVLDALADAGEAPAERAVYGTDGNLGERLADLVEDPADLACFGGVLGVAHPPASFAQRVREHASIEAAGHATVDLAAESYDATVVAALAAAAAGSDRADAIAASMGAVTAGGEPCSRVDECLELLAAGADVAYVGQTGRLSLDADGNRTEADLAVVSFDGDGHLLRRGGRRTAT